MRERFFSLIDALRGADLSTPEAEARSVRAAIVAVANDPEVRTLGGMLYVSRNTTRRGRPDAWLVDVSTDLVIPPNLELRLAPGVALVPLSFTAASGAALDVRGPLTAPLGAIFATSASAIRWRPELFGVRHEVRPVRFTGNALERVHPEWWGAGIGDADLDGPALVAAIRAAHLDRRLGERWLPPLVVELSHRYELTEPLAVNGGARPGTLAMRGLAGSADLPHLVCAAGGRFSGSALLTVSDAIVSLDNVRFDAAMRALVCVQIDATLVGASLDGAKHRMYQCTLRGATDALLRLDASLGAAKGVETAQAPALSIEGGVFEPARSPTTGEMPVAARLVAPSSTTVEFRSVTFSGEARAMIHASSCMVSVTHCAFRNTAVPIRTQHDTALLDTLHASGPEGGVDIFLDTIRLDDLAASVSAIHCLSSSIQFLVARGVAPRLLRRDSTIIGLRHDSHGLEVRERRPANGGITLKWISQPPVAPPGLIKPWGFDNGMLPAIPVYVPAIRMSGPGFSLPSASPSAIIPAILWDGESQGGGTFTLCGCRFDRTGAQASSMPAVVLRGAGQPLRDLGAVRGDPNANFPIFGVSRRIATEEVFVDVPT